MVGKRLDAKWSVIPFEYQKGDRSICSKGSTIWSPKTKDSCVLLSRYYTSLLFSRMVLVFFSLMVKNLAVRFSIYSAVRIWLNGLVWFNTIDWPFESEPCEIQTSESSVFKCSGFQFPSVFVFKRVYFCSYYLFLGWHRPIPLCCSSCFK